VFFFFFFWGCTSSPLYDMNYYYCEYLQLWASSEVSLEAFLPIFTEDFGVSDANFANHVAR